MEGTDGMSFPRRPPRSARGLQSPSPAGGIIAGVGARRGAIL